MCDNTHRLAAIMSGGDWFDASVDHIVIPTGMDLEVERQRWDALRRNTSEHRLFDQWLVAETEARPATSEEIQEFWPY